MPVYEYECNLCNNVIEKTHGFTDVVVICPKCGATMNKIISSSTFILKGGGWYNDGYNKKEKE